MPKKFDNDPRPGHTQKYDKYEREDRPGYYAGNRDFRAEKLRNQPLENSSNFKNDELEMERIIARKNRENREQRDHRNRPQTYQ